MEVIPLVPSLRRNCAGLGVRSSRGFNSCLGNLGVETGYCRRCWLLQSSSPTDVLPIFPYPVSQTLSTDGAHRAPHTTWRWRSVPAFPLIKINLRERKYVRHTLKQRVRNCLRDAGQRALFHELADLVRR